MTDKKKLNKEVPAKAPEKIKENAPKISSEKNKALEITLLQIEKQFGKGSIMKLGQNYHENVQVIPTGSLTLDMATGIGGVHRLLRTGRQCHRRAFRRRAGRNDVCHYGTGLRHPASSKTTLLNGGGNTGQYPGMHCPGH